MAYILLWIGSLATVVVWTALMTAWSTRRRSPWARVVPAILLGPAPVLVLSVALSILTGYAKFGLKVEPNWFHYVTSWTVCLAAASVMVLGRGLRTGPSGPAARGWSTARLAAVFGVGAALVCLLFMMMDMTVRAQVGSLREQSHVLAAVARPPRPMDRDNAAILYDEAFEALRSADENAEKPWQEMVHTWDDAEQADADRAALSGFLDRHGGGLKLLRQAGRLPGCFFDHHAEPPSISFLLPELAKLRGCAHMLALDARYRAAKGDTRAALADVAALRGLARHTGSAPYLVSALVAIAVQSMAARTLEAVLAAGPVAVEDLAVLKDAPRMAFRPMMRRSLLMEQALGASVFAGLGEGDLNLGEMGGGRAIRGVGAGYRVFFLQADLAGYRTAMDHYMRRLALPEQEWEQASKGEEISPPPPEGLMGKLLMPSLSGAFDAALGAEAHQRLMQLAVAAVEFHAAEGRYPASLDDLAPTYVGYIPLDPFTGRRLKMAGGVAGVVFYSVGPDRQDDGGRRDEKPCTGDVCIRLGKIKFPTTQPR